MTFIEHFLTEKDNWRTIEDFEPSYASKGPSALGFSDTLMLFMSDTQQEGRRTLLRIEFSMIQLW